MNERLAENGRIQVFTAVVERENAPGTKSSNISMSQGWQRKTLHGQWCPMEPHKEAYAPSL